MNEQPRSFGGARSMLMRLLEEARKRLIETGARNRLIHTPRDRTRSNSVSIVGANPDQIFILLARKRTPLSFVPGSGDTKSGNGNLALLRPNDAGQELVTILPSLETKVAVQEPQTI